MKGRAAPVTNKNCHFQTLPKKKAPNNPAVLLTRQHSLEVVGGQNNKTALRAKLSSLEHIITGFGRIVKSHIMGLMVGSAVGLWTLQRNIATDA